MTRMRIAALALLQLFIGCGSARLEVVRLRLTDPRDLTVRDVTAEPRRLVVDVVVNRPTAKLEYFLEQNGKQVTVTGAREPVQLDMNTLVLDMVRPDRTPLHKGRFVLVVRGIARDGHTHGGSQKNVDYDGP